MNIVVLGPGAIGSLWAIKLKQAGHRVSVWGRQSVSVCHIQLEHGPCLQIPNHIDNDILAADLILVTVKSWQVAEAVTSIRHLLQPETMILFMHNGMGVIDKIKTTLNNPLLIATTSHGATKEISGISPLSPIIIRHTGEGQTRIGAGNQQGRNCMFMQEVLHHALPPVFWQEQIHEAQWQKLAINCAINPLTAIHQCKNGDLLQPDLASRIQPIIGEICQIMNAEKITVNIQELRAQVIQVITNTSQNHSSMQQDILNHRKTEIDHITGYVLKKAKKHQIPVPENEKLYHQIKSIEAQWRHL